MSPTNDAACLSTLTQPCFLEPGSSGVGLCDLIQVTRRSPGPHSSQKPMEFGRQNWRRHRSILEHSHTRHPETTCIELLITWPKLLYVSVNRFNPPKLCQLRVSCVLVLEASATRQTKGAAARQGASSSVVQVAKALLPLLLCGGYS